MCCLTSEMQVETISRACLGLLLINLQNIRNEKTNKKNARMKQNRFLVCAPSNAAVDELMKKIIIAFKEKCQNKQEPLGKVYLNKSVSVLSRQNQLLQFLLQVRCNTSVLLCTAVSFCRP